MEENLGLYRDHVEEEMTELLSAYSPVAMIACMILGVIGFLYYGICLYDWYEKHKIKNDKERLRCWYLKDSRHKNIVLQSFGWSPWMVEYHDLTDSEKDNLRITDKVNTWEMCEKVRGSPIPKDKWKAYPR